MPANIPTRSLPHQKQSADGVLIALAAIAIVSDVVLVPEFPRAFELDFPKYHSSLIVCQPRSSAMPSASVASPPAALIAARVLARRKAAVSVSGFLIFLRHAMKLSDACAPAWWVKISAGVSIIAVAPCGGAFTVTLHKDKYVLVRLAQLAPRLELLARADRQ